MSREALLEAMRGIEHFENVSIDIEPEDSVVLGGIVTQGNKSERMISIYDEYERNQLENTRKAIDERIQQIIESGENVKVIRGNVAFHILLRHNKSLRRSILNQGRTKELADIIRQVNRNKTEEQRR